MYMCDISKHFEGKGDAELLDEQSSKYRTSTFCGAGDIYARLKARYCAAPFSCVCVCVCGEPIITRGARDAHRIQKPQNMAFRRRFRIICNATIYACIACMCVRITDFKHKHFRAYFIVCAI